MDTLVLDTVGNLAPEGTCPRCGTQPWYMDASGQHPGCHFLAYAALRMRENEETRARMVAYAQRLKRTEEELKYRLEKELELQKLKQQERIIRDRLAAIPPNRSPAPVILPLPVSNGREEEMGAHPARV